MASNADREEQVCTEVSGKITSLDKFRIDRVFVAGMELVFDDPVELGPKDSVVIDLTKYRGLARSVESAP